MQEVGQVQGSARDEGTLPFYRASDLEMAAGWVPGHSSRRVSEDLEVPTDPLQALENTLREALLRPPCVIGFSGGRDSSALLAVAISLARREGLTPPIAATNVYPDLEETDESDWQELVIRYLGIEEWVRQEFTDETDLLAPSSLSSLRRHGPLWPATMHNRAPIIALARGGSYITGNGGDELLGEYRSTRLARVLARQVPTVQRAAKDVVWVIGPGRVRQRLERRALARRGALRPWLRPRAAEWFADQVTEMAVRRPLTHRFGPVEVLRRRGFQAAFGNLNLIGESLGVRYVHPFLDPAFAVALGRCAPTLGFTGRTETMRALFGHLLPDAILSRNAKVYFNSAYAHRFTREFVASWDGSGLDDDLIDAEALKDSWQNDPVFHGGSFQLVHLAWLASNEPA